MSEDSRLNGYISLEVFRETDCDRSSRTIRDNPQENILLSGSLYDYNIENVKKPLTDDWNK